jgi:hypothetical protein
LLRQGQSYFLGNLEQAAADAAHKMSADLTADFDRFMQGQDPPPPQEVRLNGDRHDCDTWCGADEVASFRRCCHVCLATAPLRRVVQ